MCNGSLLEFQSDSYFLLSSMAVLSGSRIRISAGTFKYSNIIVTAKEPSSQSLLHQ
jgi:hypothetical protein